MAMNIGQRSKGSEEAMWPYGYEERNEEGEHILGVLP